MAKKKPQKASSKRRLLPSKEDREKEIAKLEERIQLESPARGYAPPLSQGVAFRALPLSAATLRGLDQAQPAPYVTMTDIQNACIPHALAGRDIMGAAKTGSGKTLAYLIPLLERLVRARVTPADGPAAVVLSPTRELAVQILAVLRQIGTHQTQFTVGLLMGGKKDFYTEQQHVCGTNILICTPGRLLQHLEQTPHFDISHLQVLVLDEADRILDLGFRPQLLRILEYLPKHDDDNESNDGHAVPRRQTMLFSATQTRQVSHLATLSLYKPEYLGVHDQSETWTPASLQQSYLTVPLDHKLDAVYSFVTSHRKCKSLVFFATCAQVRHAWELFCALRPGIPVMALHGKLVQSKRTQIYWDFCKQSTAVLFCTDVCARGLDMPHVDWVLQADAPEDLPMYIHRVGRTARYRSNGKALLLLTPQEEKRGFVETLLQNKKQLPIKRVAVNPSKTIVVAQRAASLVAADANLHRLAKKAFLSYVRSIRLQPNKDVFQVFDLPLEAYATSLGLASTPHLPFDVNSSAAGEGDREENRAAKNVNRKLQKLKQAIQQEKLAKKVAKLRERGKYEAAEAMAKKQGGDNDSEDDDDDEDLLLSKRQSAPDQKDDDDLPDASVDQVTTSRHKKRIRIAGSNSTENKRIVFDEEGQEQGEQSLTALLPGADELLLKDKTELAAATEEHMEKIRNRLEESKEQDRLDEKERVRSKHRKRRLQEKGDKDESQAGAVLEATLGSPDDDGDDDDDASAMDSDSASGSSSNSSSDDNDDSSSASEDEDEADPTDLKRQEEMALSLIRARS